MKKCSKCGKEKNINEFYKMNTSKDGHRPDCKNCRRNWEKSFKKNNPVRHRCSAIGQGIISRTVTDVNESSNKCYKDNGVVSKIGNTGKEISDYLFANYYDEILRLIEKGDTPSLNRIDSSKNYEEGNIEIVTLRENYLDGVSNAVKKTSKAVKVIYKDDSEKIFKSVSEASRALKIKRDTIIRNRDNKTKDRKGRLFIDMSIDKK